MLINFNEITEMTVPGMNGGTGEMSARMYMSDTGKIIPCRIHAGGSIGLQERFGAQYRQYRKRRSGHADGCGGTVKLKEKGKRGDPVNRCPWCTCNEKMTRYHDEEWGVPLHDDQKQFEFLMMEVMQCGLNWNMMIQKREVFRECFAEFDFDKVAEYGEEDIERIMNTEGMIRSRRKIEAVIHNARCFQKIRDEYGSFSEYIWGFTKGKTYLYTGHQRGEIPARNGLSDRVSKDLKKRGMKYMGAVTVYSHLQACGIINDHMESCFRYPQLLEMSDTVHKRRDKE